MSHPIRSGLLVGALLLLSACVPPPDLAADRAELLRLHALQREAHLQKRAELLAATFADTLHSIAAGRIDTPDAGTSQMRIQRYLDRSTFAAWDDLTSPVIRISPDGQMAYVIVQKDVRLTALDSLGTPREEHTIFAWLETYEKAAGQWRLHAIASTDRPGSTAGGP